MKHSKEIGPMAILCVRAISAAIITVYALGHPIPMQALQLAELLTVCINTAFLLLAVGTLAIVLGHVLLSSGLPKAPKKRTPPLIAILGLLFAFELAAFALIGWWFTLSLRVTAFVIVKTTPYEEAAA